MSHATLSLSLLKRRIENKAFAYGISSTVGVLLAEYVIDLLRAASHNQPVDSLSV